MATIKAFRGVRYNSSALSSLICPPYDVISPEEKARLQKSSPDNMVRLELPDASGARNKYQQARQLLNSWMDKGVLCRDEAPALYFYEQTFNDHGTKKVRRGFFAALRLENPHGGAVKPHERTLAKPKADRLKLIRSVNANLSPIFGLFHDKNKIAVAAGKKIAGSKPDAQARDRDGVAHKLWCVTDPSVVARIEKLLVPQKVFIADGHHRYETAWNYSQERKKKKGYSREAGYNYVMIFLCPMEDPGLVVWPTHRVVAAPAGLDERIAKYFDVLPGSEFKKRAGSTVQPLLILRNGKLQTLVVKNTKILAQVMPDKCTAYRQLGVSILHSLLLPDVEPHTITYVKNDREAIALARKRGHIAAIVPPTPVAAVQAIATAQQTMPQKSTYFYPKVASGIVIHAF